MRVSLDDEYCTDDFVYFVVVATPQNLQSRMEKLEVDFLSSLYPYIIVRKLTPSIIKEASQELIDAEEDSYWLKLYHLAGQLDINHIHAALDQLKKDSTGLNN